VNDIIRDITRLAGYTPKEIIESKDWANTVKRTEAGRASLYGTLEWETLFSALYRVYMLAFMDLKTVLKTKSTEKKDTKTGTEKTTPKHEEEGFKEPKRKRRNSAEGNRPNLAKKRGTIEHKGERTTPEPQTLRTTRNFFAPLRDLETEGAPETGDGEEETENSRIIGKDSPPLIIITAQINLLKFQGE